MERVALRVVDRHILHLVLNFLVHLCLLLLLPTILLLLMLLGWLLIYRCWLHKWDDLRQPWGDRTKL